MAMFEIHAVDEQIKALPTVDTVSGSVATFETDMTENLIEVVCGIQYSQASGTPSPTNPLPILTFDDLTLYHNPINLWNEQWEVGSIDNTTGKNTVNANTFRTKGYIKISQEDIYLYIGGSNTLGLRLYDENKNFTVARAVSSSGVLTYGSATIPTGTAYIRFVNVSTNSYSDNISFNYPSTETGYNAFNGAYIPFGQTVAKGTLNVTTGVLEIERESLDLGSLNWNYNSSRGLFYALPNANVKKYGNNATVPDWNCEIYPTHSFNEIRVDGGSYTLGIGQGFISGAGNNCFCVRDDSFSGDYTAFKTAVTGYKLVYDVENVYTVQLSAKQITALLNENNIWCDTNGDTEVKFILSVGEYLRQA